MSKGPDSVNRELVTLWGPSASSPPVVRWVQGCLNATEQTTMLSSSHPGESPFDKLWAIHYSSGARRKQHQGEQIKNGVWKTLLLNFESIIIFLKNHLKMQGLINKLFPTVVTFIPCTFWLCNHRTFYLVVFLSSDILHICEKMPNRPKVVSRDLSIIDKTTPVA